MNAIERLKRDHHILRAKLDVLEGALAMGPRAWFVLREMCFTLARQLQDHMRREEELITQCHKVMTPKVLAEIAVEHRDEPRHIQAINRLFLEERGQSLERIRPALQEVIVGLRRHMTAEEAELFPLLERELAAQEAQQPVTTPGHLEETMTVNRVLRDYPRTRGAFERLFVNVPMEGCTCLDELAWTHGMDVREMLELLEGTIRSCECQQAASAPAQERVPALP